MGQALSSSPFKKSDINDLIIALNTILPSVEWRNDIHTALWNKLAINSVINPLTAIHQCRNGKLANDQFKKQISILIKEISQVLNAENIAISHQSVVDNVYRVIESTAQNFSSMHQDIAHHRTTEIDFITGYLIRTAQKHGLNTPHHYAVGSCDEKT